MKNFGDHSMVETLIAISLILEISYFRDARNYSTLAHFNKLSNWVADEVRELFAFLFICISEYLFFIAF